MVFKEHPPDTLEKSIRFGCGTVFGILIALYSTRRIWLDNQATVVILTAVVAIVSGVLAVRYGDRFWHFFFSGRR